MASDVERVVLQFNGIKFVKAEGKDNPITGQHVELTVQFVSNNDINKKKIKLFLNSRLPSHMLPKRIKVSSFKVGHRFKRV
jgi:hypothetical protein